MYEYDGRFIGIHYGDVLQPSLTQKNTFSVGEIKDIFPKYYVLKVNNFDDVEGYPGRVGVLSEQQRGERWVPSKGFERDKREIERRNVERGREKSLPKVSRKPTD